MAAENDPALVSPSETDVFIPYLRKAIDSSRMDVDVTSISSDSSMGGSSGEECLMIDSSMDESAVPEDSMLDGSLKSSASNTEDSTKSKEKSFVTLRYTYLLVTLVVMLADGLQGKIPFQPSIVSPILDELLICDLTFLFRNTPICAIRRLRLLCTCTLLPGILRWRCSLACYGPHDRQDR